MFIQWHKKVRIFITIFHVKSINNHKLKLWNTGKIHCGSFALKWGESMVEMDDSTDLLNDLPSLRLSIQNYLFLCIYVYSFTLCKI